MEANLIGLEQRIEKLLKEYAHLKSENQNLTIKQQSLLAENVQLAEKNKLACSRLEQIITKLRSLEEQ